MVSLNPLGACPTWPRRDWLRLAAAVCLGRTAAPSAASELALLGAGASFPFPIYQRWAEQYRRETAAEVRYEALGSGEGLKRIEQGRVDFGASDVPLPAPELQRLGLVQFPTLVGAVVPVVNLRGIRPGELRLTGELLGAIFLGEVRRWDDPALRALNPGTSLPPARITVVHRADASGSSQLFTEYLSAYNAAWRGRVGTSMLPDWPLGEAGIGNEGAASLVERTRAAIGYVEHAYAHAHHLTVASLRNRAGQWVLPDLAGFRAAIAATGWADAGDPLPSLADAPGQASWPLTSASHVLMSASSSQPERSRAVLAFFDWAFRRGAEMAEALGYVPLPPIALQRVQALWHQRLRDGSGAPLW